MSEGERLRLSDVRAVFRLVGEVREMAADPKVWRPHMVLALRKLIGAEVVVSSEIHFRKTSRPGVLRVIDIGWGCDADGEPWQIQTERDDETPDNYLLSGAVPSGRAAPGAEADKDDKGDKGDKGDKSDKGAVAETREAPVPDELISVKPQQVLRGGSTFILSQYPLRHIGAVDQLGLHRAWGDESFTTRQRKMVRLLHVELGRLWRLDVLRRAKEPTSQLPPRLAQTLKELLAGSSEKQIAMKLELSRHTVHNYVKALHHRFGVSSRGELLARAGRSASDFTPRLSLDPPRGT